MKNLILVLLMLSIVSCSRSTKHGTCIGIQETEKENLVYEVSYWNLLVGGLFFETAVVPLVVIFTEFKCPVSAK